MKDIPNGNALGRMKWLLRSCGNGEWGYE
jgi:hypothetical protein